MSELTPIEIVGELDKYIVGQDEAKRKVAIALRNRWRRQQLPDDLREEVAPKNIIMIGPTGVGKTEIARRLSKLADAPFIKVEASKFTEVGYVGRDCESMIRDLTEVGVNLVRDEMKEELRHKARENVERRLLDLLLPPQPRPIKPAFHPANPGAGDEGPARNLQPEDGESKTREFLLQKLRNGELEDKEIEVDVRETSSTPMMQVFSNAGIEEMGVNLQEMFGKLGPQRRKRRKMKLKEAREILEQEELNELVDMEAVKLRAIERVENGGIVFLDEIDKIAGRGHAGHGPDISREGVQRDILPIVEGSTVMTKYGAVRTDHILFIAAGAFHVAKVSDLIPELQGRFPIRVELQSLTREDFERILREPKSSLIKQYTALLQTEGVSLEFTDEAISEIAALCQQVNQQTEDIGARRLHTVLEYLLEDISYDAPKYQGQTVKIDDEEVRKRLANTVENVDLSKYIL